MNTHLFEALKPFKHCWFRTGASDQFVGQIAKCDFIQSNLTITFSKIVRVVEDDDTRWRAVENVHSEYVSEFGECRANEIKDQTIGVESSLGDLITFTSERISVEIIERLLQ